MELGAVRNAGGLSLTSETVMCTLTLEESLVLPKSMARTVNCNELYNDEIVRPRIASPQLGNRRHCNFRHETANNQLLKNVTEFSKD